VRIVLDPFHQVQGVRDEQSRGGDRLEHVMWVPLGCVSLLILANSASA
jgi:DNA mismatch repair protein MutH